MTPEWQYELPDFHPETGHLHTCTDRSTCDCAAHLYCIAQDAEEAAALP